jgi:hypothetical protein
MIKPSTGWPADDGTLGILDKVHTINLGTWSAGVIKSIVL